jgi:hypothetical protein
MGTPATGATAKETAGSTAKTGTAKEGKSMRIGSALAALCFGLIGLMGLIGLTGTPEEIAAMAKAYRVYYAKAANQNAPGDYLMDHSSIIYLMDQDGGFVKHFAYTTDVERLTSELKQAIAASP